MPRLVGLDFAVGRRMKIDGARWSITRKDSAGPSVQITDDTGSKREITRTELATLIVHERLTFLDEDHDVDPNPDPCAPHVINIARLPLHRVVDWLAKVVLLRRLFFVKGGPKSASFQRSYQTACVELLHAVQLMGITGFQPPAAYTAYHDLLRVRNSAGELRVLLVKGLSYRPHDPTSPIRQEFAEIERLTREIVADRPWLSAAATRRQVNEALRKSSSID
jgi:hypothetical protein